MPKFGDSTLYQILGIDIAANQKELLRAYKKLKVQNQRTSYANENSINLWKQTEFAYYTLSNPSSRTIYDKFGISALNVSGFSIFGYKSAREIELMKQQFPELAMNGNSLFYPGLIFYPVQFDLIDFMKGAKKNVRVQRMVPCLCPRGGTRCAKCRKNPVMLETVQTEIELPAGASEFFRIFVPELGDSQQISGASDIVFVAYTRPDPTFIRSGNDIHMNATVSVADVLRGKSVKVQNVDGEEIEIPLDHSVQHASQKRIHGKGLPVFGENKKRGDIVVTYEITFPKKLSEEQIQMATRLLPKELYEYE